jgi:mono/diheme cytochrome c family protein
MTDPAPRITLRGLPLAAKLVLSAFLLAVGLGYSSALVQLHLKQSNREGEALPTLDDVIERFSGLKPHDPDAAPPVSRVRTLLSGDRTEANVGKENMTPAFFARSRGYAAETDARGKAAVDAEREGELLAVAAWCETAPAARKAAYEADRFALPDARKGKPITAPFADADRGAVKIKTLIDTRCQACHKDQAPNLGTYADLEPFVTTPSRELIDGKWVRSTKQISVEQLTQSTHAHLLSFAMLFTLTGLTFAFTSYPMAIRCIVGPVVLVAQVFDVACWWLARVPGYGPFFAQTIVFTGGIVGSFLGLQIVLSLLNMYGRVGKAVLVLLFLAAAAGFAVLGTRVIEPALRAEREAKAQVKEPEPHPKNGTGPQAVPTVSKLERLIMGPIDGADWNGSEKGSMAAAFFHKDGEDYKSLIRERPKAEVFAERDGERKALREWINADPATRQAAYAADKFALSKELADGPITAEFRHPDKAVMVKSILDRRCARCHTTDSEGPEADYPLQTYEQIVKHIETK